MKILLREFGSERYVWKTAKYKNGKFFVCGNSIHQCNIVSVMNDNRKNYVQCSSCGKVFKKNDIKFELHKQNSANPNTCLSCPSLITEEINKIKRKVTIDNYGNMVEKLERNVYMRCSRYGEWFSPYITDESLLRKCKLRMCKDADAEEIHDIFTDNPGIFDDIITVDKLLDEGLETDNYISDSAGYALHSQYEIFAIVNNIGIVDRFITYDDDYVTIYYSKRYDALLTPSRSGETYIPWYPCTLSHEDVENIKNDIAKLYR